MRTFGFATDAGEVLRNTADPVVGRAVTRGMSKPAARGEIRAIAHRAPSREPGTARGSASP